MERLYILTGDQHSVSLLFWSDKAGGKILRSRW